MTNIQNIITKLSLTFLWVFTGLTSLFFAPEVGYQILDERGITGCFADFCVISGAGSPLVL